ncbi:hypothetical protein WN943_006012 [Citrus x changshan-huyou]
MLPRSSRGRCCDLRGNLYPHVEKLEPDATAKVTEILLEMDQTEILHLLESPEESDSKLLSNYVKSGKIIEAKNLFDEIPEKNAVSWSIVIHGYSIKGFHEKSMKALSHAQFFHYSWCSCCGSRLEKLGTCEIYSWTNGEIWAVLLFNFFRGSSLVPNAVTMLTVIRGYAAPDAAIQIFREMECKDIVSWTRMTSLFVDFEYVANAILGDLKRGKQLRAQVVLGGLQLELCLSNSIIAIYSKCGDLDSSRSGFNQITEKSLVSWTAVILGYVQNGCAREALDLLIKMRQEKTDSVDSIMLVSILTVSGQLAALEICLQLHCLAFEAGFSWYRSVQNSLILSYSKCGNVDLAYIVFEEMGFLQDFVSWNAIINGYGVNGHGETALALYHTMTESREVPDNSTYLSILNACSHAGLTNDGLVIFNPMIEENKVKRSQEHYGCVVDLLARVGCYQMQVGLLVHFWKGWVQIFGGLCLVDACSMVT